MIWRLLEWGRTMVFKVSCLYWGHFWLFLYVNKPSSAIEANLKRNFCNYLQRSKRIELITQKKLKKCRIFFGLVIFLLVGIVKNFQFISTSLVSILLEISMFFLLLLFLSFVWCSTNNFIFHPFKGKIN